MSHHFPPCLSYLQFILFVKQRNLKNEYNIVGVSCVILGLCGKTFSIAIPHHTSPVTKTLLPESFMSLIMEILPYQITYPTTFSTILSSFRFSSALQFGIKLNLLGAATFFYFILFLPS